MAQKEIIETILNTSALALTSFGVLKMTTSGPAVWPVFCLLMGILLEFAKYSGRKKKLW